MGVSKKVREKSRECHNHKPQPFPDPKRKRKPTNLNKHKPNKRTKSTKISSLFPKRGNRNTKRTEKHKNKMTHGKTSSPVFICVIKSSLFPCAIVTDFTVDVSNTAKWVKNCAALRWFIPLSLPKPIFWCWSFIVVVLVLWSSATRLFSYCDSRIAVILFSFVLFYCL